MERASGVLLPVFSLPSKYGIGCFSKEAYKFIDRLKEAGQSYWQILPLGPTGYGDSPYQSFSTYAGNPYFIDPKTLIKEGLLTKKECKAYDFGDKADCIDYEKIYNSRFKMLKKDVPSGSNKTRRKRRTPRRPMRRFGKTMPYRSNCRGCFPPAPLRAAAHCARQ